MLSFNSNIVGNGSLTTHGENQLDKRIKKVKYDHGGEYDDIYDGLGEQGPGPFTKYLEECGVVP
jgi:hypothetical protein